MLYRKFLNVVQCYFAMEAWRQVAGCSGDAAVFLDNCAGELLHYVGGVQVLGEPVGVYNLYSSLNPVARNIIAQVDNCHDAAVHSYCLSMLQAPYCHVVMVVTTPLLGTCAERISSLLTDLQPDPLSHETLKLSIVGIPTFRTIFIYWHKLSMESLGYSTKEVDKKRLKVG